MLFHAAWGIKVLRIRHYSSKTKVESVHKIAVSVHNNQDVQMAAIEDQSYFTGMVAHKTKYF